MNKTRNIKEAIIKELRNPESDAFNIACRKNLSINEWKPDSDFGGQINQKTVLLTVRMFDLWETALVDIFNEYIGKKFKGVRIEHTHDSKGDLTIVLPDGEKMIWEIKTTQAQDSWTGATHSASKYDDYILIGYDQYLRACFS